jgi:hypothetical protein
MLVNLVWKHPLLVIPLDEAYDMTYVRTRLFGKHSRASALSDDWSRFGGVSRVRVMAGAGCGTIVGCDRLAAAGGSA